MSGARFTNEQYTKDGEHVINFVIYETNGGYDKVLQHKISGAETAHITLHPDGTVNLRIERPGMETYLVSAVKTDLAGYKPDLSDNVKQFLIKVRDEI